MQKTTLLAVCLAVLMVTLACSSGGDGGPAAEPTQTASPTPTDLPSGTRTGIAEIDAVLDAVFSGDEEAVRALIGYSPTPCATNPQGIGAPPQCIGDETDGTLIDFFGFAHCHGSHVRPENMGSIISRLSQTGVRLRAVSAIEDTWPDGDHVVVYDHIRGMDRVPHNALVLVLREGAIVGIKDGCQGTPEEYLANSNLDEPLLFIPPDGLTGVRELDMFLDALVLNDPDVLRPFIGYQFLTCTTTSAGVGGPPLCRREDEPGGRVEVFPLNACELEYRRHDELEDLRRWLAESDLHAVYATETAHKIVMRWAPPDDDLVMIATVEGRHIVGFDSCGRSAYDVLDDVPPDDILIGPLWP